MSKHSRHFCQEGGTGSRSTVVTFGQYNHDIRNSVCGLGALICDFGLLLGLVLNVIINIRTLSLLHDPMYGLCRD